VGWCPFGHRPAHFHSSERLPETLPLRDLLNLEYIWVSGDIPDMLGTTATKQ
jgi:hypothetical protein